MRIKGLNSSLLIILLIILRFSSSCTPAACIGETTAFLKGGFYKTGTSTPLVADTVTIFGIGKDSAKIYSKALKVSLIQLPLDASSDKCSFVMKINSTIDTLTFEYSSYPHMISKECGVTFFYILESCRWRGSIIDTINIRNNNIRTINEENIRIFY
jgi:hypothetical protein